ncbi:MAG: hypothetical protein IKN63_03690 [Bacilli bacterium]|nr:hypothetical protein [Bacilli bacterium]
MKKFIKDYLKIIAYSIIGLVFVLASFYLIMNYNHNEELTKNIFISNNESNYIAHQELLTNINNNLNIFKNKKNKTNSDKQIADRLERCYNVLNSDSSFSKIELNKEYTAYDIYKIGADLQNNIINECWNTNFSFLVANNNTNRQDSTDKSLNSTEIPKKIKIVLPILNKYVSTINDNVTDSLKEIQNNSSYFYTTNIASATIRNYLGSDYSTIVKSYNDFTSIILYLTEIINEDEVITNG